MADTIKRVILGADHTCAAYRCRVKLLRGTTAVRRSWRAYTYHERCHADGRGECQSYYCDKHAPAVPSAAGVAS